MGYGRFAEPAARPRRGVRVAATARVIARAPAPPLQVLIVDDEPLIRWSLAETLRDCGDGVMEAECGEAAVRALTASVPPPDVVLLDYCLPDSADLSLLSTVRQVSPRSRVILMTAECPQDVMAGALRLGADRVLIKPFDMQRVVAILHQFPGARTPEEEEITRSSVHVTRFRTPSRERPAADRSPGAGSTEVAKATA